MYATQAQTSTKSHWMIPSFRSPFPVSALYKVQKQEMFGTLDQKPKGTGSRNRRFSSITFAASKLKLKIRSFLRGELVIISDSGNLTWEFNLEIMNDTFYMCFLSISEREAVRRNPKYFGNSAIPVKPEIERIPIHGPFGGKEIPEFTGEDFEVLELKNGADIGVDIQVPELTTGVLKLRHGEDTGEETQLPELTIKMDILVSEAFISKDSPVSKLSINTYPHELYVDALISSSVKSEPSSPPSSMKQPESPPSNINQLETPPSSLGESESFNIQRIIDELETTIRKNKITKIIADFESIIRKNKANSPLACALIENTPKLTERPRSSTVTQPTAVDEYYFKLSDDRPRSSFDTHPAKALLLTNQFSTVEPSNYSQHSKTKTNRLEIHRPAGRGDAQIIFSSGFFVAVGYCSPSLLTEAMIAKVERFCCLQIEYNSFGIGTIQGYLNGHARISFGAGKQAGMVSAVDNMASDIEKMYRIRDCETLVEEKCFCYGLEYQAPGLLKGELDTNMMYNYLPDGECPGFNEGYLGGFLEGGYLDGYVEDYIEYGKWELKMKAIRA